jgi:hypothetical protein
LRLEHKHAVAAAAALLLLLLLLLLLAPGVVQHAFCQPQRPERLLGLLW